MRVPDTRTVDDPGAKMTQQTQPTKEQIRLYMEARKTQQCPPPSIPEIRRQLGWGLTMPDSAGRRDGSL
jgi:hypothetical protein